MKTTVEELEIELDKAYQSSVGRSDPFKAFRQNDVDELKKRNAAIRDGIQGIAGSLALLDPAIARYVALLSQLKVAQTGVSAVASNIGQAFSSLGSLISNPYVLAGAAVLGILAAAISTIKKQAEEEAEALRKSNEEMRERLKLAREISDQARQRQREIGGQAAQALDTAGLLGAGGRDPREQERALLADVAQALAASGTSDRNKAIEAAIEAIKIGREGDDELIAAILNLMQLTLDGQAITAEVAGTLVKTPLADEASRRAAARRASTLGFASANAANEATGAAELSGALGRRIDELNNTIIQNQQAVLALKESLPNLNDSAWYEWLASNIATLFGQYRANNREDQAARGQIEAMEKLVETLISRKEGLVAEQGRVNAQIYVAPGGTATIYGGGGPFKPGAQGFQESSSKGFADAN